MHLLAATDVVTAPLVGQGVIGVVLLLLMWGRVRLEREVTERDARIADLTKERDRWMQAALTGTKVAEIVASRGRE